RYFHVTGVQTCALPILMLPGTDGLSICRQLRQAGRTHVPVLMLTAKDLLEDKIEGFEAGADDYLVKPFSLAELEVRLKALVRREIGSASCRERSAALVE